MILPVIRTLLVALSVAAATGPAWACETVSTAERVATERPVIQSSSSGRPRLPFDLFANRGSGLSRAEQAQVVRVVDSQRLGHGSWICSPAGAGMLSSCFHR